MIPKLYDSGLQRITAPDIPTDSLTGSLSGPDDRIPSQCSKLQCPYSSGADNRSLRPFGMGRNRCCISSLPAPFALDSVAGASAAGELATDVL